MLSLLKPITNINSIYTRPEFQIHCKESNNNTYVIKRCNESNETIQYC